MILLDYTDKRPIYEQITDKFRDLIYKGILQANEKLPSVRSLASELSINPNTIQRAYSQLEQEGFLYSISGKGNFVSNNPLIFENRKTELLKSMETIVLDAKMAGIHLDELIEAINKIYKEDPKND